MYVLDHLGEEGVEASARYVTEQVTAVGTQSRVLLGRLEEHVELDQGRGSAIQQGTSAITHRPLLGQGTPPPGHFLAALPVHPVLLSAENPLGRVWAYREKLSVLAWGYRGCLHQLGQL